MHANRASAAPSQRREMRSAGLNARRPPSPAARLTPARAEESGALSKAALGRPGNPRRCRPASRVPVETSHSIARRRPRAAPLCSRAAHKRPFRQRSPRGPQADALRRQGGRPRTRAHRHADARGVAARARARSLVAAPRSAAWNMSHHHWECGAAQVRQSTDLEQNCARLRSPCAAKACHRVVVHDLHHSEALPTRSQSPDSWECGCGKKQVRHVTDLRKTTRRAPQRPPPRRPRPPLKRSAQPHLGERREREGCTRARRTQEVAEHRDADGHGEGALLEVVS